MKILTVGHDERETKHLINQLEVLSKDITNLNFEHAKLGKIGTALKGGANILIYDAAEMNSLMGVLLQEIRKTGFLGPIIISANIPQGMNVSDFYKVKNLHILEKPYIPMQLLGLVKNCIMDSNVQKRRYKRFDVRESATLEAYSSDYKTKTIINNISQSGACIEGDLNGLKKGDLLRLHFNFDKIKKERVMSARVVWKKKEGDNKDEAGLEFVSQKAVYQYLLNHAIA